MKLTNAFPRILFYTNKNRQAQTVHESLTGSLYGQLALFQRYMATTEKNHKDEVLTFVLNTFLILILVTRQKGTCDLQSSHIQI